MRISRKKFRTFFEIFVSRPRGGMRRIFLHGDNGALKVIPLEYTVVFFYTPI